MSLASVKRGYRQGLARLCETLTTLLSQPTRLNASENAKASRHGRKNNSAYSDPTECLSCQRPGDARSVRDRARKHRTTPPCTPNELGHDKD